ncbi:MAG: FAD-binding oxidoreductase [Candidatus Omnitrophota bacterium]
MKTVECEKIVEFKTEVLEVIPRTHNVKSFRFAVKENGLFKPGQFFRLTLSVGGKEESKYFSFSNSPTETGYIEFTKRITESDFSKTLIGARPGDPAAVAMPYGNFTFEGEYDKVAFLSGGIGVTPFRSMCKYATDMKLSTDIVLVYSNRTERDIVFRDDFDEMSGLNPRIRVINTLTSEEAVSASWRGRIGRISGAMLREEVPDINERVIFVCGPQNMVTSLKEMLRRELCVGPERIRAENFMGY